MNNTNKIDYVIEFLDRLKGITAEIDQVRDALNEVMDSTGESGDSDDPSARIRELEEGFVTVNEIIDQLIMNGQTIADTMDKFIDPEVINNSPEYRDARETVDKSPRGALYHWTELKERLKVAGYHSPLP